MSKTLQQIRKGKEELQEAVQKLVRAYEEPGLVVRRIRVDRLWPEPSDVHVDIEVEA